MPFPLEDPEAHRTEVMPLGHPRSAVVTILRMHPCLFIGTEDGTDKEMGRWTSYSAACRTATSAGWSFEVLDFDSRRPYVEDELLTQRIKELLTYHLITDILAEMDKQIVSNAFRTTQPGRRNHLMGCATLIGNLCLELKARCEAIDK